MNKSLLAISLALAVFSANSFAAKSESAGNKGNANSEQMRSASESMHGNVERNEDQLTLLIQQKKQQAKDTKNSKERMRLEEETQQLERERKELRERNEKMMQVQEQEKAKVKANVKQTEKKAEQERKEMGKGSEMGQEQREENSKKWWQFGGD